MVKEALPEATKAKLPTSGHDAFWHSSRGINLLPVFGIGPTMRVDTNPVMVGHFHRFLDGASDDMAIMGWRYVMNYRKNYMSRAAKRTA